MLGKKVEVRGAFSALPSFPLDRAVLGLGLLPSQAPELPTSHFLAWVGRGWGFLSSL